MGDRERGSGEGALLDSVANNGKRPRKLLFLICESRRGCDGMWRRKVQNGTHSVRDASATYNSLLPKTRRFRRIRKGPHPLSLRLRWAVFALVPLFSLLLIGARSVAQSPAASAAPTAASIGADQSRFAPLDALLRDAVEKGNAPGAVLLVGHNGAVVYRKAFGNRALEPSKEPMTPDTVFDTASLTKVLATTTSVMRMVQLGQVKLNDPVAKYIPDFAQNGKTDVTVRQLMTHYSGLRPDLDLKPYWRGLDEAYTRANAEKLVNPPGAVFVYSDVNFIVLGELVQRVSGMPLNQYAQNYVFGPLGMTMTTFNPPETWTPRIAPTEHDQRTGAMLRGVVHDPTARAMGGVAGHAGVFSTADDLAKFAQAIAQRRWAHFVAVDRREDDHAPTAA